MQDSRIDSEMTDFYGEKIILISVPVPVSELAFQYWFRYRIFSVLIDFSRKNGHFPVKIEIFRNYYVTGTGTSPGTEVISVLKKPVPHMLSWHSGLGVE